MRSSKPTQLHTVSTPSVAVAAALINADPLVFTLPAPFRQPSALPTILYCTVLFALAICYLSFGSLLSFFALCSLALWVSVFPLSSLFFIFSILLRLIPSPTIPLDAGHLLQAGLDLHCASHASPDDLHWPGCPGLNTVWTVHRTTLGVGCRLELIIFRFDSVSRFPTLVVLSRQDLHTPRAGHRRWPIASLYWSGWAGLITVWTVLRTTLIV
ncbi:hypothetical protein OE88DRAFT_1402443 [Heliocybe sulcata]|uniref:Uncharacterized protein n=1 Tax=Heliocybe sulcata TaxID=5364 RepID=A0A5C3N7G9_9AGAM|nr:hypothetical protein OE88DRAFT_1402443 [Heliocybe sulcata]